MPLGSLILVSTNGRLPEVVPHYPYQDPQQDYQKIPDCPKGRDDPRY